MKLHIKNMVCNRCKTIVKPELDKLAFNNSMTHQLKRETGLTPSHFRQLRNNRIKVTEIN
jgi:hypothetical protein